MNGVAAAASHPNTMSLPAARLAATISSCSQTIALVDADRLAARHESGSGCQEASAERDSQAKAIPSHVSAPFL